MSVVLGDVSVQQETGHQCQAWFPSNYYEGSGTLLKSKFLLLDSHTSADNMIKMANKLYSINTYVYNNINPYTRYIL